MRTVALALTVSVMCTLDAGPGPCAAVPDSADGDPAIVSFVGVAPGAPASTPHRGQEPAPEALVPTAVGLLSNFALAGLAPEGDGPHGVAFSTDGVRIFVAHRDTQNIVIFNAATRDVIGTIALSGSPAGIAVSSDGVHAVTPNIFEDTASIIDLDAGLETAVIPVGQQPGVVRITPNGALAVVGNTVDSSLSVIDIAKATELRRIPGAGFTGSIVVSFETGTVTSEFNRFELATNTKLVHADFSTNQIKIFDIGTGGVVVLPSSPNPRGVAVTPDGSKAVVTHAFGPQVVSVVDVAAPVILKTIAVGADLDGPVAVEPTGTKAAVAVLNATRVVNLLTNAVSPFLATGSVNALVTTSDGSYALAVGFQGSLISYASQTIVKNLNTVVSTALGAVSPADDRAVMVANVFGEDMLVVNTDGVSAFTEAIVPSGPPPEGDKARNAAITADGQLAAVVNILSDNLSIVDPNTLAVLSVVPVGDRPSEAEITADGTRAVIANLDSPFASVVDLALGTVASVPISTRGSQVEISPDDHYAYVAVVMNDGVWRIDLDTLSAAGPKLSTGNMGSIGYNFSESSGMTLSHDGATLVTCNSFSNSITIIDTGTWTVAKTLGVGGVPARAAFSPDDTRIFVTNRDGNSVSVVNNAGALSFVITTVPVGAQPIGMDVSADGSTLYVANYEGDTISVVDFAALSTQATITAPDHPLDVRLDASGERLLVASGVWSVSFGPGAAFAVNKSGQLSLLDRSTGAVVDQVTTGLPPAIPDHYDAGSVIVVPSPFGDGVTIARATETGPAARIVEPLLLRKLAGGELELSWGTSCQPSDGDYEVYEGTLGEFTSHAPLACSTGGLTVATIAPAEPSTYYLVVPASADREGSYGLDSSGAERPPALDACRIQSAVACPP